MGKLQGTLDTAALRQQLGGSGGGGSGSGSAGNSKGHDLSPFQTLSADTCCDCEKSSMPHTPSEKPLRKQRSASLRAAAAWPSSSCAVGSGIARKVIAKDQQRVRVSVANPRGWAGCDGAHSVSLTQLSCQPGTRRWGQAMACPSVEGHMAVVVHGWSEQNRSLTKKTGRL